VVHSHQLDRTVAEVLERIVDAVIREDEEQEREDDRPAGREDAR